MINAIDRVLSVIEKRMIQVLFIFMTIITLIQVFNRVLFNYPMPWGDEAARYSFIWVVYIASSYAVREKVHIGVTALVQKFPAKIKRISDLLTYVVCFLFSLGLFILAVQIMKMQISMVQTSPALRLPMEYVYAGLAAGGLLMTFRFALQICACLKPAKEPGDACDDLR